VFIRTAGSDFNPDTSPLEEYFAGRGASFLIGFHHLVCYLLVAGQITEAMKVTASFIATFAETTEDQPIPEGNGLGNARYTMDILMQRLECRRQWWRAARELAFTD